MVDPRRIFSRDPSTTLELTGSHADRKHNMTFNVRDKNAFRDRPNSEHNSHNNVFLDLSIILVLVLTCMLMWYD